MSGVVIDLGSRRVVTNDGCSVLEIVNEDPGTDYLQTARRLIDRAHEKRDFMALSIAIGLVIKALEEGRPS